MIRFMMLTIVAGGLCWLATAGENLLPNSEFVSANGKAPDHWYAHQEPPRALIPFSVADGVAKNSQRSASRNNQLIVSAPVGQTARLRLSIDYKLDALKQNGGALYHFVDASGKRMQESVMLLFTRKAVPEWQTFTREIAVPKGAVAITITLAVYGSPEYPEASFQFRKPVLEAVAEESKK